MWVRFRFQCQVWISSGVDVWVRVRFQCQVWITSGVGVWVRFRFQCQVWISSGVGVWVRVGCRPWRRFAPADLQAGVCACVRLWTQVPSATEGVGGLGSSGFGSGVGLGAG